MLGICISFTCIKSSFASLKILSKIVISGTLYFRYFCSEVILSGGENAYGSEGFLQGIIVGVVQ